MAQKKKNIMTSPKAPCKWAFLSKPNTKWKEEGEYKVTLVFAEDDPFISKLTELSNEAFEEIKAGLKPAQAKTAKQVLPFKPELDADGEETGNVEVSFKTNASRIDKATNKVIQMKPRIYDAKNQLVKKELMIGNGSVLNVNFSYVPQFVKGECYLSLYLNAVRVVTLVEFAPDGSSMFGEAEEDGFDADEFEGGGTEDTEEKVDDDEEF